MACDHAPWRARLPSQPALDDAPQALVAKRLAREDPHQNGEHAGHAQQEHKDEHVLLRGVHRFPPNQAQQNGKRSSYKLSWRDGNCTTEFPLSRSRSLVRRRAARLAGAMGVKMTSIEVRRSGGGQLQTLAWFSGYIPMRRTRAAIGCRVAPGLHIGVRGRRGCS